MSKRLYCLVILLSILPFLIFSQKNVNDSLSELKKNGKLTGNIQRMNENKSVVGSTIKISSSPALPQSITNCDCWIPRDSSFSVVPFDGSGANGGPGFPPDYRNDDWSTSAIILPFDFCFYGANINQVYINNNGNISFGAAYSTFTSNPFPDSAYSMIAPFWGDVDTRNLGSGLVYYKLTSTYLIVQWDSVGYYSEHSDKVNTFQLIINNGSDPLLPDGNNISFCYKDMQWTTGDASSGINGFGGEPATVGVNQGDGVNYVQFGRFDQPGNSFDGPFLNPDGIDWLDNQSFIFNTCNSTNFPPVINGLRICDTLTICENDTINIPISCLSPL